MYIFYKYLSNEMVLITEYVIVTYFKVELNYTLIHDDIARNLHTLQPPRETLRDKLSDHHR